MGNRARSAGAMLATDERVESQSRSSTKKATKTIINPREEFAGEDTNENQQFAEHPNRVTHCFWLRQYSGLHSTLQMGESGGGGSGSCRPSLGLSPPGTPTSPLSRLQTSQPQPQPQMISASGGRSLKTRWNNLIRNFGGSTGQVEAGYGQGQQQQQQQPFRSGTCSAPACPAVARAWWRTKKSHKRASSRPNSSCRAGKQVAAPSASALDWCQRVDNDNNNDDHPPSRRPRKLAWLLRSVGSTGSASVLVQTPLSHATLAAGERITAQPDDNGTEQNIGKNRRRGTSAEERRKQRNKEQQVAATGAAPPASPRHASPYRQVMRALTRSKHPPQPPEHQQHQSLGKSSNIPRTSTLTLNVNDDNGDHNQRHPTSGGRGKGGGAASKLGALLVSVSPSRFRRKSSGVCVGESRELWAPPRKQLATNDGGGGGSEQALIGNDKRRRPEIRSAYVGHSLCGGNLQIETSEREEDGGGEIWGQQRAMGDDVDSEQQLQRRRRRRSSVSSQQTAAVPSVELDTRPAIAAETTSTKMAAACTEKRPTRKNYANEQRQVDGGTVGEFARLAGRAAQATRAQLDETADIKASDSGRLATATGAHNGGGGGDGCNGGSSREKQSKQLQTSTVANEEEEEQEKSADNRDDGDPFAAGPSCRPGQSAAIDGIAVPLAAHGTCGAQFSALELVAANSNALPQSATNSSSISLLIQARQAIPSGSPPSLVGSGASSSRRHSPAFPEGDRQVSAPVGRNRRRHLDEEQLEISPADRHQNQPHETETRRASVTSDSPQVPCEQLPPSRTAVVAEATLAIGQLDKSKNDQQREGDYCEGEYASHSGSGSIAITTDEEEEEEAHDTEGSLFGLAESLSQGRGEEAGARRRNRSSETTATATTTTTTTTGSTIRRGASVASDVFESSRPSSQPGEIVSKLSPTGATVGGSASATIAPAAITSTGFTTVVRDNFKRLVKRQQSVDSYRMARELKNKQRRQQESGGGGRTKQRSNEAIKTRSVGDDRGASSGRKFSMISSATATTTAPKIRLASGFRGTTAANARDAVQETGADSVGVPTLKICVDPYARPGTFTLPDRTDGRGGAPQQTPEDDNKSSSSGGGGGHAEALQQMEQLKRKVAPTPPSSLSLMPASGGSNLFMGTAFSGCITPTYPTHHLPSPKYVSPATLMAMQKKYSNASTISSSLGCESSAAGGVGGGPLANNDSNNGAGRSISPASGGPHSQQMVQGLGEALGAGVQQREMANNTATNTTITNPSDTESSLGAGSVTPSRRDCYGAPSLQLSGSNPLAGSTGGLIPVAGSQQAGSGGEQQQQEQQQQQVAAAAAAAEEAAAAARRANLAEHIYDNKCGLGEDMKFLASLPELCDITFLVGETREPVCAVKSVLAARSRVFHKILFGDRLRLAAAAAAAANKRLGGGGPSEDSQQGAPAMGVSLENSGEQIGESRRDSSPRSHLAAAATSAHRALTGKSSGGSPQASRSVSPNQQQQRQWSVTSDATGFNPTPASSEGYHTTGGGGGGGSGGLRSGRVSVASGGRESVSHVSSQDSQQPLIIGPGQTATPVAKRGKKSLAAASKAAAAAAAAAASYTDGGGAHHHQQQQQQHSTATSRLSRMFMNKRASDPSIKHAHKLGVAGNNSSQASYLDKMSSSQMSTTMIIEEFEPDVFRQLIEYIHTGCVLLQARTLLGLLNAADYYGLEQLRKACLRFVSCCITVDTVCSLLSTAERYIQYKCTKSIVQKVLEFVDTHADEIFKLNAFGLLPEHVVRLILARDGLKADEHVKYNGVYTWCEHYCRSYELTNIADIMRNFLDLIQFHQIPTNVLLTEIYPTHIVPDNIFLSALAYQADPENFEPKVAKQRRMTLPNPTIHKNFDATTDDEGGVPLDDNDDENVALGGRASGGPPQLGGAGRSMTTTTTWEGRKPAAATTPTSGQSFDQAARNRRESALSGGGSQQRLLLASRKSAGPGSPTAAAPPPPPPPPKSRKGSIAQASISGVKRLSHKLSIRKRHSNMTSNEMRRRDSGPLEAQAAGKGGSSSSKRQQKRAPPMSKQASFASGTRDELSGSRADLMQVGQQILNAYLSAQRQQELEAEEAERRQRELAGLSSGAQETTGGGGVTGDDAQQQAASGGQAAFRQAGRQSVTKSGSNSRKSFKDFRHISRRLFMRHSSSKMLQQQSSTASVGTQDSHKSMDHHQRPGHQGPLSTSSRRHLLKIKRSETVAETTTSGGASSTTTGGGGGGGGGTFGGSGGMRVSHQLFSSIIK